MEIKTKLEQKLDMKCEHRVVLERSNMIISDHCANCEGYNFQCENYIPIKRTQRPTRQGLFAQREYFE